MNKFIKSAILAFSAVNAAFLEDATLTQVEQGPSAEDVEAEKLANA